jgi:hypothetical protein
MRSTACEEQSTSEMYDIHAEVIILAVYLIQHVSIQHPHFPTTKNMMPAVCGYSENSI